MKADDIYATVTESIIAKLESGDAGRWNQSWTALAGMPANVSTGRAYRGFNVVALWSAAEKRGYPTQEWATYNQWQGLKAQVREGEKGNHLVKWVFPTREEEKAAREQGRKIRAFPRGFAVFNAAQVDGWTPPDPGEPVETIAEAEAFFLAQGAVILTGEPAYVPRTDTVLLPPIDSFDSAEAYYATSAHEHVHRTGAESRLNREGIASFDSFGSERYAREELIAELGSAFTCAYLGISTVPRPDHAAYVASWIRQLRSDPKAIQTAASQAQRAVDYMVAATGVVTEVEAEEAA